MDSKINIIECFSKWLENEGKLAATINSYKSDVKKFNKCLDEKDLDPKVILSLFLFTNYMKQLEVEGMAVTTMKKNGKQNKTISFRNVVNKIIGYHLDKIGYDAILKEYRRIHTMHSVIIEHLDL